MSARRIERRTPRRSGRPPPAATSNGAWHNLALLAVASLAFVACGSDGGGVGQAGSGGSSGESEASVPDAALPEAAAELDGPIASDGAVQHTDALDPSDDGRVTDGRAVTDAPVDGSRPDAPEPFCEAWSYPIDETAGCFGDLQLVCVRDRRFEVCPQPSDDGGDTIDRNCEPVLVCMISPEDEVYVMYNFGWAEVLPGPGWRLSSYFEQPSMLTAEEELRCEAALRHWRKPCR